MASFARWCFVHRKAVLAGWLIALIGFFAIGQAVGSVYNQSDSLPGTDSAKALSALQANFPTQAGDSEQIVVQAKRGTAISAAEAAVTSMLARVAPLPHVRAVTTPYELGGQISKDGTIGLATVYLDALAQNVPKTRLTNRSTPPSPRTARSSTSSWAATPSKTANRTGSPPARASGSSSP